MGKIGGFLRENGEILLGLLPLMAILGILLVIFFKMLVSDPKSILGAVFAIIGVVALLTVPAFFIDGELWGNLINIVPVFALLIWFAVRHPKRMVKLILIVLAVIAALVGISFVFGIAVAAAVAVNGFFGIFLVNAFKDLRSALWLEKNGIRTEGEIISLRYSRTGTVPLFGYTAEDGTYFRQETGGIYSTGRVKLHEKFTLIYDPNAPAKVCAERYALKDAVSDFVLFALLEAGILGATICMFIFLS